MHALVPPFILDRADDGELVGSMPAAVLLVDATGSTPLTSALSEHGNRGAEVLASIMWDVFAPQVDAVLSYGGTIGAFTGDGFIALFPGTPEAAVSSAVDAAGSIRTHMETGSVHTHEFGESEFDVKSVVAYGEVTWHIWITSDDITPTHSYMVSGQAVREARLAESPAATGAVAVVASARDHVDPTILVTGTELCFIGDHESPSDPAPIPQLRTAGADRFVPARLSSSPFRGEFRRVVSSFVKLRAVPDPTEPDNDMSRLLAVIRSRGGFVSDIHQPDPNDSGVTVLTFWGAPRSFESTIERAVTFLLEARDTLGANSMRAAATVDTLFAGFIGSDHQAAYTCLGAGVNLAARMVSANDWGDIWLDDAMADMLAEEVVVDEVGTRTFRGFDDATTITALLGKGDVEIRSFFPGEFAGRDDEMATVLGWLEKRREAPGGVIVVSGEAGVGKSRLLHEIQDRIGGDVRWMVGHTDPIGRAPFNPVAYMIRRGMNIHLEDPPATMRDKVDERIARILEHTDDDALRRELEAAREPVLSLIGALPSTSPFNELSGQLQFERVVEAVTAVLAVDARHRFVVAHLEDGQWVDAATIELLGRIVDSMAELPFAVVLTSRQPVEHPWVEHVLELGHLGQGAVATHVASLLGATPSPDLVELLETRTGGNPFYVEQIIGFMQSRDLLVETDRGLAARYSGARVPTDLQAVLIAQIDRLAPRVRLAVQHAAILGREFDLQILLRMLGPLASQADIDEAEHLHIWTALSEIRYLFQHGLLRDAAYEMQLGATRIELHAAAAEAIEFLTAGDPGQQASALAHHLDLAERPSAAARWYVTAAGSAQQTFANEDAVQWLNRGLELADDDAQRYDALVALESTYRLIGQPVEQDAVLTELEDMVSSDAERLPLIARLRVAYLTHTGDYEAAIDRGRTAIAIADETGTSADQVAARLAVVQPSRATGDLVAAESFARDALDVAGTDANLRASVEDALGGIAYDQGRYEESADLHRSAANALREAGDQTGEIRALNNMGSALWGLGDFSAAAEVHREGVERSRAIGYRMSEGDNLDNLGGAHWAVGHLDDAIVHYCEALELRRRSRDLWGVGISLSNLGTAYRSANRLDDAIESFREGIEIDVSIGRTRGEAYSQHGLGWALLEVGQPHEALAAFDRAMAIREELGDKVHILESRAGRARALARAGDTAAAGESARAIAGQLDEAFFSHATEPFRVVQTVLELLDNTGLAADLTERATRELGVRADRISNPDDRASYLAAVETSTGVRYSGVT